jgi:putative transposase
MKKNIELLEPMRVYHIYNRGINGENIFKEERNYKYFLQKYAQYIEPIADTFAYCLLKNHFHIAIRTKSEAEIVEFYLKRKTNKSNVVKVQNLKKSVNNNADRENVGKGQNLNNSVNNADRVQNPVSVEQLPDIKIPSAQLIISKQFSDLFNSYAQAINKANSRTGKLFEEPFRRILVNNDAYFTELIYYIHHNPQKHGFVNDFRTYPHSSYHSHLSNALTKLKRDEVLEWFGNNNEFERFHLMNQDLKNLDSFRIEFD